ncbi:MAG: cell division protein ZapA [Clostridiaceae bacterium]|jgi:cell division protein ZapA|nr:cell division protein ZapA [Clostridiaceae bacterium]
MADKKKTAVSIFGTEYVMVAEKSEEYINDLAGKVDAIMTEIAKSNSRYNPTMVAVLTALNLADELQKSREEYAETAEKLENIQGEMQRPFEELNELRQELEAIKEQYTKMQGEYTRSQIELGKISREWAKAQEELKDLRCELDVSKETINEVQNKLFENQIELLKAKKELDDTKVKSIDKNRNIR